MDIGMPASVFALQHGCFHSGSGLGHIIALSEAHVRMPNALPPRISAWRYLPNAVR
jgi:hypothetical protein